MTFREAEDYLLGLELFGMRFGLDRMHKLMTVLGMPQRRFASIHVVGSNGKSSTVRMIAAILEREGLRTGSYTSPHLRTFAERVEVGERPLPEPAFAAAVARAAHAAELVNRTLDEDDEVTQFEALTAAAYHALASSGVEVAVIEAGLGGRYDATNVIPSKVQALTTVGLEHTRWLGPTIEDIAREKLAVVRDHATLVTGPLVPEAARVARRGGGSPSRKSRRGHGAVARTPGAARRLPALELRGRRSRRRGVPGEYPRRPETGRRGSGRRRGGAGAGAAGADRRLPAHPHRLEPTTPTAPRRWPRRSRGTGSQASSRSSTTRTRRRC